MRDIRGRIAQRQGIDLTNQQIQDLAARRLESILDPRAIKPSLLDGLRRSASAPTGGQEKVPNEPTFTFEDTTIYDSHRGALRLARWLLNPLLKLLFNPNPLIRALHLQAKLNVETAERNAERDRRQTEWNSLHFEIVQRLVTEVSRVSIELQALSMRVDALGARVDFNDRRVGQLEGSAHRARPQGRPSDSAAIGPVPESITAPAEPPALIASDSQTPDASRRRRRRRRGRRGGTGPGEYVPSAPQGSAVALASDNAAGAVLAVERPPEEPSEAPPALGLPLSEQVEARVPAPDPLPASIDLAAGHPSLPPPEADGDQD